MKIPTTSAALLARLLMCLARDPKAEKAAVESCLDFKSRAHE
jgi:hypothetical protein